ncbi:MAG: hypothetical protein AAGD96_05480 [Chloroflexota bacterium]
MKKLIESPFYQLAIFGLYVLMAVIAGWQVLTNLNGVIIGYDNDVYLYPWGNWWTLEALTNPSVNFWSTNFIFYPSEANLIFHSFSHLNTLVALALEPLFGPLGGHNISIWLNYPLIGFAMYHLARHLIKNEISAILAGIAFAFSSHAMYQSAHANLLSIWCFPWAILFFMRAAEENKIRYALIAALFVFLGAATSTLLLLIMVLIFLYLTIYFYFSSDWTFPSWKVLLVFLLGCAVATLLTQWPLIVDFVGNSNSSFIVNDDLPIIADMLSPIIPHWYFWLWRGLYFGFVGIYLMLFAGRSGGKIRIWVILLISTYLISVGPYPTIFGQQLGVVFPWSFLFTPILRNPYRFNILMSLAVSLLIGYGWIGILSQVKSETGRIVASILCPILLFADYGGAQIPTTQLDVSPFFSEYLENVDDSVVLTSLPTSRQEDKYYMYLQSLHGHRITNGMIARPEQSAFDFINSNSVLMTRERPFGTQAPPPEDAWQSIQDLQDAGVGYVIFHKRFLTDEVEARWRATIPFEPIYEDTYVFAYQFER